MTATLRTATVRGRDVELTWSDDRPPAALPLMWLRDNCPASLHPDTRQRQVDTFAIAADVAVRAIAVEQHGQDHLLQVRPVILAVAVLTQRLPAGALEVQAGGVHEHQVEPREQVASMRE